MAASSPPPSLRQRRRRLLATVASSTAAAAATAGLVFVALSALAPTPSIAHTFLTVPQSMSHIEGCRIGGSPGYVVSCPGPCPAHTKAMLRDPPTTTTIRRGGVLNLRYSRNNHEGGFARYSLVPADRAMDGHFHTRAAFLYTCWDTGAFKCRNPRERWRDCKYDDDQVAYKRRLRIPRVYPDGLYVLGFAWWGGLDKGKGFNAALGDYYDCRCVGGVSCQKGDGREACIVDLSLDKCVVAIRQFTRMLSGATLAGLLLLSRGKAITQRAAVKIGPSCVGSLARARETNTVVPVFL